MSLQNIPWIKCMLFTHTPSQQQTASPNTRKEKQRGSTSSVCLNVLILKEERMREASSSSHHAAPHRVLPHGIAGQYTLPDSIRHWSIVSSMTATAKVQSYCKRKWWEFVTDFSESRTGLHRMKCTFKKIIPQFY